VVGGSSAPALEPLNMLHYFLAFVSLFFQNSGYASSEVPDDKALIGFAQISITD
jgi:hypothetical protein